MHSVSTACVVMVCYTLYFQLLLFGGKFKIKLFALKYCVLICTFIYHTNAASVYVEDPEQCL